MVAESGHEIFRRPSHVRRSLSHGSIGPSYSRKSVPHPSRERSERLFTRLAPIAGGHFAEPGGASYQPKDGAQSKELFELSTKFMRQTFETMSGAAAKSFEEAKRAR